MNDTYKPEIIKTYAVAVIEALWPTREDFRGGQEKDNILFTSGPRDYEILKFSPLQSKYQGYYKIIPLNLLNITVSLSKESSSFSASFTANQLLFLTDDYLPLYLKNSLEKSSTRINKSDLTQYPFLEKVLSGTSDFVSGYIVNYHNISQFIRELDTISIYLVPLPEHLSIETLPIFIGQNPSRVKELEYLSLKQKELDTLTELGISVGELNLIDKVLAEKDFENLLYYFRKISYNFIISLVNRPLNVQFFSGNQKTKSDIYKQEKETFLVPSVEQFINYFGRTIFDYYFGDKKIREKTLTCIDHYYKHGGILAELLSWSAFETIRLKLNEILNVSPGLCFERSFDFERNKGFKEILNAIVIDLYMFLYANMALVNKRKEDITLGIEQINKQIGKNVFKFEDYMVGITKTLKNLVERKKIIINRRESYFFENDIKVEPNESGDGLSLVFRGHITDISRSLQIRENEGDIVLTIRGKGFSYPLENHEIYADYISIKFAAQPLENYSVKILSPIQAIFKIFDSFAPYRIKIIELDSETFMTAVLSARGFDLYYYAANPNNILVSQGNVVAPSYEAKFEELIVFNQIHYVSTKLLNKISLAFNTELVKQKFLANANIDIPTNVSVFDAIKKVVSTNSAYKVYVDQYGYLKLEYEPANISFPFSLMLNSPITEYNTFSIEHSSSESNVVTFCEVLPTSFGIYAPSEMGIASIYGRSIAPPISEIYSYINYIDNSKDKFLPFLKDLLNLVDKSLKKAIKPLEKFTKKEQETIKKLLSLKTFINQQSQDGILKALLGIKNTEQAQTEISAYVVDKRVEKITEACTGETREKETLVLKQVQQTVQNPINVQQELFSPKELSYLFNVSKVRDEFFKPIHDYSYYKAFPKSFVDFNEYILDLEQLLKEVCPQMDSLAKSYFNLSNNATICYQDNIKEIAVLFLIGKYLSLYGQTSSEESIGNLVTNIVNTIRIRSSESILRVLLKNSIKSSNELLHYFKNYFFYIVPYTDFSQTLQSVELILENSSPDFFIYGLRRKTFQDVFVAVLDEKKNENRVSSKRAEVIRRLNSKPINTVKAEVIGNNYFVGFTTLVINEKLPPINDGFISVRNLLDLEDANYAKNNENIILCINEIVFDSEFKKLYPHLIPKIPGYSPPSASELTVEGIKNYYKTAINFILSFGFTHVPYQFWIPLWGVYTEKSLNSEFLGDYIKIIMEESKTSLPDSVSSDYLERFNKFIVNNQQYMQTYSKYVRPQNYLVGQGHIENVEHHWSVGSVYTTTLGINYLIPAIYTYLPIGNEKLILSYLVLDSPLSKFNESGTPNKFINDEKFLQFFRTLKRNYYEFYKFDLNFIDTKVKLKILDIKKKLNL